MLYPYRRMMGDRHTVHRTTCHTGLAVLMFLRACRVTRGWVLEPRCRWARLMAADRSRCGACCYTLQELGLGSFGQPIEDSPPNDGRVESDNERALRGSQVGQTGGAAKR